MPIINPLPYNIADGQAIDAVPVMADLNQIVSNVNANAAAVAGNASQEFLVATTTNSAGAVPLAQAQSQFASASGLAASGGAGLVGYSQGASGSVSRTVAAKLAESVSVLDFGTAATDFTTAAAQRILVLAPQSGIVASDFASMPPGQLSSFVLTASPDGNAIGSGGVISGPFTGYPQAAGVKYYGVNSAPQASSGESETNLLVVNLLDDDTTAYTSAAQADAQAVKVYASGHTVAGAYTVEQTKNIIGQYVCAVGNTGGATLGSTNGVSAFLSDTYQFGVGICDNEFAVHNPSAANGGQGHSVSMACVQATVYSDYAASDGTHTAYCFLGNNGGTNQITAGYALGGGNYSNGIDLSASTCANAAIVMPDVQAGAAGTEIVYGAGYTQYDRSANSFEWIISGAFVAQINSEGICASATPGSHPTWLFLDPSSTGKSHMQLYPGATPSSPNPGDMWFDGTHLYIRIGGTTTTIV